MNCFVSERLALAVGAVVVAASYVLVGLPTACLAITPQKKTTHSGNHYQLFFQDNYLASWTTTRPTSLDESTELCVPAAFTGVHGGVVGLYSLDGSLQNKSGIDRTIGGEVCIENGHCRILSAPGGKIDPAVAAALEKNHGQIFQAFQVVRGGQGEHFKDKTVYQRRGICKFKNGTVAVVESDEAITLTQFGVDLQELEAQDMADMDMGAWDEGWYRPDNGGKLVVLGKDRSSTNKQSNWLVFRKAGVELKKTADGKPIANAPKTDLLHGKGAAEISAKTVESFVPSGWRIERRLSGNLSGGSVADWVLQLVEKNKLKKSDTPETLQRMLIVLGGQPDGSYKVIASATKLLYCTTCAGMMGDSEGDNISVKIVGGMLVVHQEMGDADKTDTTYKFQWDAKLKSFILREETTDDYSNTENHQGDVTKLDHIANTQTVSRYSVTEDGDKRFGRKTTTKIKPSVQRMENIKISDP